MTAICEYPRLAAGRASADALRGRDMLCFSHDWNGDPLSKTHLMRLLARDNRILWVNSIGYRTPTVSKRDFGRALSKLRSMATRPMYEAEKNIFVLNPFAVPFYGTLGQRANQWALRAQIRRAMRQLNFRDPINWIFNPAAAVVARQLNEEMLIYYCVDEYAAFAGVPSASIAAMEKRLLDSADVVVVSAERLLQSKRQHRPDTLLIRHGVDVDHFRKALDSRTEIPEELRSLPRPIIGYFGLIAQDWVDVDLMVKVAKRFRQCSIVMLGKVTTDLSALESLPNVHLLGRKPYASLPGYCRGFDVSLIPFPINEVTLNANPLKAREYLAAGLPVISTAIPEVQVLGDWCRIGRDADEFCRQIEEALKDPGPSRARSELVRNESWAARLDMLRRHITQMS
jgi:glycosyltransferase involved in cell wall biosynthesis